MQVIVGVLAVESIFSASNGDLITVSFRRFTFKRPRCCSLSASFNFSSLPMSDANRFSFLQDSSRIFLEGVSTRHFHLQLAEYFARSTVSSGFGLAFGLGLRRWWLAAVVGLVALNLVGSTDRFSARTDATSTLAGLQSIRGEDINFQSNCHRALGNVPHRCCMTVRVDGLCVPPFLEVRSFPYVNLLVARHAVVSLVGLRKFRLRPLCATCSRFALPPKGLQAASLFRVRELEQTHVLFPADIMNRGGPFPRWR